MEPVWWVYCSAFSDIPIFICDGTMQLTAADALCKTERGLDPSKGGVRVYNTGWPVYRGKVVVPHELLH